MTLPLTLIASLLYTPINNYFALEGAWTLSESENVEKLAIILEHSNGLIDENRWKTCENSWNAKSIQKISPVVNAGVHSCSPVAPHSRDFDGVVVTDDANGRFATTQKEKRSHYKLAKQIWHRWNLECGGTGLDRKCRPNSKDRIICQKYKNLNRRKVDWTKKIGQEFFWTIESDKNSMNQRIGPKISQHSEQSAKI